jgi:LmbE family N-acetylglucosaminyl deacetylase
MTLVSLPELGRYDALYLSPHADDAALACAGRMLGESARGERGLVIVFFDPDPGGVAEALHERGVDVCAVGLVPGAGRRAEARYRSLGFERSPADGEAQEAVLRLLADIAPRVRARQVYVPLGVGGHIDHRLLHEAALQVLTDEPGRNLFLYEERPEAFTPGAVRVRLGLLGARLPPAATEAAERASLPRYLLRVQSAAAWRGDLRGWGDRLSTVGAAAGEWRSARVWNPQKAFGPRLQPVVQPVDAATAEAARAVWARLRPGPTPSSRGPERWRGAITAYARKLGSDAHAERFWLVLPAIHGAEAPARREELLAGVAS